MSPKRHNEKRKAKNDKDHHSPKTHQLTIGELSKFKKWLLLKRGIKESTAKDYLNALRKLEGEAITPESLIKLYGKSKYYILGLRLYVQFLDDTAKISEDEATFWLKRLKASFRSKPSFIEISEEEVVKALKVIREKERHDIEIAYLIMLFSGCRLSEAVELMNSFKPERVHKVNSEYSRYALMFERGAKKALWLYLPNWLISRLREEEYALSRRAVTDFARRYGILAPKYMRKFFYQKALDLGLDRETIDFMQGRVSGLSIGARHYDSLLRRADKEYGKVLEELRKLS